MQSRTFLLSVLLVLSHTVGRANGKVYRWYCDITGETLDTLVLDRTTGKLHVKNPEGSLIGDRSLETISQNSTQSLEVSYLRSDRDFTSAVPVRQVQQDDNVDTIGTTQEIQARQCWCANNDNQIYSNVMYYCIAPYSHCALPAWWLDPGDLAPGCTNRTLRERFVRGVWPVILVWFAFLLTCVCCTKAGRQVPDYIIAKVIPGWNEWVVNRILRRDPDRANRLIREHWRRRRVALERRFLELLVRRQGDPLDLDLHEEPPDEGDPQVHELVLKTRVFKRDERQKASNQNDQEGSEEEMCTICFASIDDGDRVGELPCNHVFHSECLKMWLARRNICPLCQMEDVATSRPRTAQATLPMNPDSDHEDNGHHEDEAPPEPRATPSLPSWRDRLEQSARARYRRRY